MILGEAMPKQIADSYFGLCRLFGDLDKKTVDAEAGSSR
jgi:hypothetical protein